MDQPTRFIGMDVHKDTIVVAVTAAGDVGNATPYGTFPNTAAALEKLVKRLRQAGSSPLKFCYEAGPCGYGVHRTLTRLGKDCMVVARSMIPRKSGERQKNDKRDAANLAVLHRSGLLTAVWVPDAAHEAMRDLIRSRLTAVRAVRMPSRACLVARQQLSAFLLRHERIYPKRRIGAITKAGDIHARTLLIEAAHSYRFPTASRVTSWPPLPLCQRRCARSPGRRKPMPHWLKQADGMIEHNRPTG
jgi:transposase